MGWDLVWWFPATLLILVGLVGTIIPALPGPLIVFVGILLGAWAEDFVYLSSGFLLLQGALTAVTFLLDFIASALGTRSVKATRAAFWGAMLGGVVGLFFGIPGLLFGPFFGALIAEFLAIQDLRQAGRAGIGAWLGVMLGTAAKFAIVILMIGLVIMERLF